MSRILFNLFGKSKSNREVDVSNEYFNNEFQQLIQDIENVENKKDCDLAHYYSGKSYNDDLKRRLRETKIGSEEYTLLHLAAKNNRRQVCAFLIHEFAFNIDIQSRDKSTPIHYFIRHNKISKNDYILEASNSSQKNEFHAQLKFRRTFQMFLQNECDFNLKDSNGRTALHIAAEDNNYVAILHLVKVPKINLNLKEKNGLTPLHLACINSCQDTALLLIEHLESSKLVDLILSDSTNGAYLPLHLACNSKQENLHIIKAYLDKINQEQPNRLEEILRAQDNNKQTILHLAIEKNHLNIIEILFRDYNISKDLKEGINGNLPIHLVAKLGSIEILNLLVKYDAFSFKTNNNLENALHIACANNRSKFIREFLKYESFLLEKNNIDGQYVQCACVCESDLSIPSVRVKDLKLNTPLFVAVANSNQKCVEELLQNEFIELDATDYLGNTVYHVCVENDNIKSFKYLLDKTKSNSLYINVYELKNGNDETILHVACRKGNLEITNLIMTNLLEHNSSTDELLFSKNKNGFNCFHLATQNGYFNLVEYFLKKKKLTQFIRIADNEMNTSLHLATQNGHLSIVSLLLELGADANVKNAADLTPLEMSCRQSYFEITKLLVDYSNLNETELKKDEFPLHYAARDGAHEIVRLLLAKGAKINQLNSKHETFLDIAIKNDHRDVIKVLLDDPNWYKLIRLEDNNFFTNDEELKAIIVTNSLNGDCYYKRESTMTSLYKRKMWDMMSLILDKCKLNESEYDFRLIDTKNVNNHPLMLFAKSGQQTLIKHEVTSLLIKLKWRLIPKFVFYLNLVLYFLYLFLYSKYVVELSDLDEDSNLGATLNETSINFAPKVMLYRSKGFKNNNANKNIKKNLNSTEFLADINESFYYHINKKEGNLNNILVILILIQLIREIFILIFLDGFTYFLSFQNLIEITTYVLSLISLFSIYYHTQCNFGSIAVLFAYILLPLFLQKFKTIGLYVIALQRTLSNSCKLFPVFMILFIGFIFSFRVRSNFGVNYSESSASIGYSFIRTFTMVVGELDTSKMGIYNSNSITNFIIYFLFIGLMCTILLNLFIGIAVDDIKTILDEADIQLVCMKIIYVLKVQAGCLKICLFWNIKHLIFEKFNYLEDNHIFKLIDKLKKNLKDLLESKRQQVNLLDPQKRLESLVLNQTRETNERIQDMKSLYASQINTAESKLLNSQRRLQDSLNEFAYVTSEQINNFRDEVKEVNAKFKNDLESLQKTVKETNEDIAYTNRYFNTRLTESEQKFLMQVIKLESILIEMAKKALFQFESVKESCITEPKHLKSIILDSEKLLEEFLADLIKSNSQNIAVNETVFESFVQNEILEKLIKPGNEELKLLINNMFDKTIEKFQKLQSDTMGINLKSQIIDSISQVNLEYKREFESIKREYSMLNQKLDTIESQITLLNKTLLKDSN